MLKEVIKLVLIRKLLGGDPLDPLFHYTEHYLGYIIMEFIGKVRPTDQVHGVPIKLYQFPSVAGPFQVYLDCFDYAVRRRY
jgi:hypothetical protein